MSRSNTISCGLIFFAVVALLHTACSSGGQVMDREGMVRSYTQISREEACKSQAVFSDEVNLPYHPQNNCSYDEADLLAKTGKRFGRLANND